MRIQYCCDVEIVFLLSKTYMGVLVISMRNRIFKCPNSHASTINKRTLPNTRVTTGIPLKIGVITGLSNRDVCLQQLQTLCLVRNSRIPNLGQGVRT